GGARLLQAGHRNFDGLIRVESLLFERGQFVVLENVPPFAFRYSIVGDAFAPWLANFPFTGHGSRRALVFRAHGAARGEKKDNNAIQDSNMLSTSHYYLLEPCAGACGFAGDDAAPFMAISCTRTSWPSSSESAGLRAIQSCASRPCKTSRLVPVSRPTVT